MKKMILTLMMVLSMTIGANAQRLDNTYMEARILTDHMADELGLNSWQIEKAYQMNLDYLNGISSYRDIDAQIWTLRNNQLKSILNAAQWNLYKKASYFYRPISWRQGAYVHNIYAKYPTAPRVVPNNRVTKPMPQVNRPVTLPLQNNERPVNVSTKRNPGNMTAKKEEPKRSFGSMRR